MGNERWMEDDSPPRPEGARGAVLTEWPAGELPPEVIQRLEETSRLDADLEVSERVQIREALERYRRIALNRLRRARRAEEYGRRQFESFRDAFNRAARLEADLQVARSTILDLRDALNRALKARDELLSQVAEGTQS